MASKQRMQLRNRRKRVRPFPASFEGRSLRRDSKTASEVSLSFEGALKRSPSLSLCAAIDSNAAGLDLEANSSDAYASSIFRSCVAPNAAARAERQGLASAQSYRTTTHSRCGCTTNSGPLLVGRRALSCGCTLCAVGQSPRLAWSTRSRAHVHVLVPARQGHAHRCARQGAGTTATGSPEKVDQMRSQPCSLYMYSRLYRYMSSTVHVFSALDMEQSRHYIHTCKMPDGPDVLMVQ